MIFSKKHSFLFLKGRKVGGTSVEMALSQLCGEQDIVTPITPIDERERLKKGKGRARNFSYDKLQEDNYIGEIEKGNSARIPLARFYNHMPYHEVVKIMGDVSKKICIIYVERSPYSKILSWANMQLSFKEYQVGNKMIADLAQVRRFLDKQIENDGIMAVKNIGIYSGSEEHSTLPMRYESLYEDFYELCINSLEVKIPPLLPHAKKGLMANRYSPTTIYSKKQIKLINEKFEDEFLKFDYEMIM